MIGDVVTVCVPEITFLAMQSAMRARPIALRTRRCFALITRRSPQATSAVATHALAAISPFRRFAPGKHRGYLC